MKTKTESKKVNPGNKLQVHTQDLDNINQIIQLYFEGLHFADLTKLKAIFHPDTVLKAPNIRRTLNEWLSLVATRDIPAVNGAKFDYRVISIDVVNSQAMVKLICPLLGSEYLDFIGLLKENGKWLIVNKMYAYY